jgi:CHAT domain-containing protein
LVLGGVDYEDASGDGVSPDGLPGAPAPSDADRGRAPPGGRFAPLSGAAKEFESVRRLLAPDAAALSGSAATEARVRREAPGRRRIHFATHAFVREDLLRGLRPAGVEGPVRLRGGAERHLAEGHDPMTLAALALAGANSRDGGDGDDGILTAAEASHLDLDGCDLVVLSACETARGTPESGEGVMGLVRGFRLAGASRVVGSLWRVDDDATLLLMERFYAGLLRRDDPLAVAEALRRASQWLRDAKPDGKDLSAPRYWAAFVAYGR